MVLSCLRRHSRFVAAFLLIEFLFELGAPTGAWALTSGPNQPEFSSFEPVATTNMVNEFTGDFTYNLPLLEVPGPHGSGYPLSLSYHSGVSQEEEASWVGYGWTLNPGAINRNTRGFPDDFNGKSVTFHNKAPKNWTVSAGAGIAPEVFGKDAPVNISASFSIRYNNYRGFGYNAGIGVNFPVSKGLVNLSYDVSEQGGKPSFSLQLSPASLLSSSKEGAKKQNTKTREDKVKTLKDLTGGYRSSLLSKSATLLSSSQYSMVSFSDVSSPTSVTPFTGASGNFSMGVNGTFPWVPVGFAGNIFGSYTSQENTPSIARNVFGYMYSSGAGTSDVMDYQLEKDDGFDRRDVFLGQPFNMADNFLVSGEGIGGSFRMFHKQIGHFGPNQADGNITIGNLGLEANLGVGLFGGGADVGAGSSTTSVKDWNRAASTFYSPTSATDEPVFFRFNGDLGGELGTNYRNPSSVNDRPIVGQIAGTAVSVSAALTKPNDGIRVGRSSYIGYRTKSQIDQSNSYSKLDYTLQGDDSQIGEFTVFNEMGMRYLYALPVYNTNEKNLSYGVQGAQASQVENNHLVYYKNTKTMVGDESGSPYTSAYLLTEVTTPDYIDLTANGPSLDDFGGYTRLGYTKAHSNYRWRMPYNGLKYSRNSLSDGMDDLGTVSYGEREVYYLGSIETKTHVAIFTLSNRNDGLESGDFDAALSKTNPPGTKQLKRLDRIDLYSVESYTNGVITRNGDGTATAPSAPPIKTVYFEYYNQNEGLCLGILNKPTGQTVGKLTLKRVYFEYNGVTKTRISPYVFEYQYPDFNTYPLKYRSGTDNVSGGYSAMARTAGLPLTGVQNPSYDAFNTDAWGNYQANGQTQYNNMQTWVDQNTTLGAAFDPAPWHLKVIKLPSGGEIHVQYEQDDYNHVQNQRAHVMARVLSKAGNTYTIDVNSIGFAGLTAPQKAAYRDRIINMITERYKNNKNKIYFKFLYELLNDTPPVTLSSCNVEYITGYADVTTVVASGDNISITFGGTPIPDDLCKEFVKTQRLGKVIPGQNCAVNGGLSDNQSVGGLVTQLLSLTTSSSNLCAEMEVGSSGRSFIRIPASLPKKGGGLRVKRLLMFDSGLESVASLYGNEYKYEATDEKGDPISSGVATNEPAGMREENILVDFVPTKKVSFISKLIAGDNLKQTEGPIGESIYPGPMVGYSRIAVRNIHSGKTNPGFSVSEYYTAKDYPIVTQMSDIVAPNPDRFYAPGLLVNIVRDKRRMAQGFSFILNDMHGQVRRHASYAGDYADLLDTRKATLISEEQYDYFAPGESIPVQSSLYGNLISGTYNPGREVDVTFSQKKIEESSVDGNVEIDFSVAVIPFFFPIIIPFPTGVPSLNTFDGELALHATTKVVRYPAILKRSRTYQDGIVHISENVAFDLQSGRAVAVKSYDEFKGAFLAQSIPASWEYPAMGGKWKSEGRKLTGSYPFDGTYLTLSGGACDLGELTEGDIIQIGSTASSVYYITERDLVNNKVKVALAQNGTAASGSNAEVTIRFTGKTNQLQSQAGDITYFNVDKNALAPAVISQTNRYETTSTNNFLYDISSQTGNLTGSGSFTMSGTYLNMDMSQFADKLGGCAANLSSSKIRNLEYAYVVSGTQITLKLMAFEIDCTGTPTWVAVRAVGW